MNNYSIGTQKKQHRIFDEVGDQTGNINMTGNYASAPKKFYVRWAPDEDVIVTGIRLIIESASPFIQGGYGSLAVLTNGIELYTENYAETEKIFHLTRLCPIKKLNDYEHWTVNQLPADETTLKRFVFTWEAHHWGHELAVNARIGNHFVCELNDDFTGLSIHEMNLYCKIINKEEEIF